MATVVQRPKLSLLERSYFPALLGGLWITIKHFFKMMAGRTQVTM